MLLILAILATLAPSAMPAQAKNAGEPVFVASRDSREIVAIDSVEDRIVQRLTAPSIPARSLFYREFGLILSISRDPPSLFAIAPATKSEKSYRQTALSALI